MPVSGFANPNNIAAEYREKGLLAQRCGDLDTALSYYQKAIQVDPQYAAALNDLGVLYEAKGALDLAEVGYLKAVEWDPNYLPPYYNLAALYEKKGKPLLAFYYWKKRIEKGLQGEYWTEQAKLSLSRLARQNADVRRELGKMEAEQFAVQVSEGKIKEFGKKVASAQQHYRRGLEHQKNQDYLLAIEEFNLALKINPAAPDIIAARQSAMKEMVTGRINDHFETARKLFELGDYAAARAELDKALALIPESSDHKTE